MNNLRETSRAIWNSNNTIEHINAGSLQRIADACESMSKNHIQLMAALETWKRLFNQERDERQSLERRNAALRGVITRLKAKTAATPEVQSEAHP